MREPDLSYVDTRMLQVAVYLAEIGRISGEACTTSLSDILIGHVRYLLALFFSSSGYHIRNRRQER
jgi:hypothetical protein